MKDSDQILLSRYVDGDLSPLERKRVESMLESDPMAQSLVSDYGNLHRFVAELPRESLDLDLIPHIRDEMTRRTWRWTSVTKSPALAGVVAASLVVCCFSIAGWLVFANPNSGATSSVPGVVLSELDSAVEKSLKSEITSIDAQKKPDESSIVAPAQIPAGSQPLQVARNRTLAPKAELVESSNNQPKIDSPKEAIPVIARDHLHDFVARSRSVDRRHAFRLHVDALSERQIDNVIGLIARYRASDTSVLRADGTENEDRDTSSLSIVALIPTKNVAELQNELRKISRDLEFDLPVTPSKDKPVDRTSLTVIEEDELARAEAKLGSELTEQPSDKEEKQVDISTELKRPGQDPVGDAIRSMLKAEKDPNAPIGTLDEVVIVIRTDLLSGEKAKAESSKKAPRPKR